MRQNNTVLYKIAGIFWGIQTILSLTSIFSEDAQGISIVIGLAIAALYGVCAYGLFIGDTYKFYKSIKIFSIILYVACGIVILSAFSVISLIGGIAVVLILVYLMLAAEFWSLTKLAGMADDNEPVDKFWYVPGVIYLITIVFSYAMVSSIASKYDINVNSIGGLISDNLIMLIFGTTMYFITGYAFYDAQKQAVGNAPATPNYQPQQRTYNVYNPNNMNYANNTYNANNMYNTNNMNNANNINSTNNASGFKISNNVNSYTGDNDGNSENSYSSGSYNLNGNIVGEEPEKKSAFTLKKD